MSETIEALAARISGVTAEKTAAAQVDLSSEGVEKLASACESLVEAMGRDADVGDAIGALRGALFSKTAKKSCGSEGESDSEEKSDKGKSSKGGFIERLMAAKKEKGEKEGDMPSDKPAGKGDPEKNRKAENDAKKDDEEEGGAEKDDETESYSKEASSLTLADIIANAVNNSADAADAEGSTPTPDDGEKQAAALQGSEALAAIRRKYLGGLSEEK